MSTTSPFRRADGLLFTLFPCSAAKGTQEPFLTLHYDEWICVLKGKILFEQAGADDVIATEGQTVFIRKDTRFR